MSDHSTNPRVLIASPEIACPPKGLDCQYPFFNARVDGFSGVGTAIINMLYEHGADVHVAIPDYRPIFNGHLRTTVDESLHYFGRCAPNDRIHLARDKVFFNSRRTYPCSETDTIKFSLAFQRELINNIVPLVQPDLIHCHDWMTGLIPAMARQFGIPCLFTVHDIHTEKTTLAEIEDRGIDDASFWENLFYDYFPSSYENSRQSIPVDFLSSGVFGAHCVNTLSQTFLMELMDGSQDVEKNSLQRALSIKKKAGCAIGILNTSDFVLISSYFEPCGLFPMLGSEYGTIQLAHTTEGIMMQSASKFNHHVAAQNYIELYEKILKRPLICKKAYARDKEAKQYRLKTHPVQDHIDPISIMPFDGFFEHSEFEIYQKKGGPHGTAEYQL